MGLIGTTLSGLPSSSGSPTTVNYTIVANPPNDDFVDATVLATEGTVSGTTVGATDELSEPYHADTLGGT